ncbi:alpha-D-ribose 1-methylphosphonate 5-triphosphate synthase subunit PhnG [Variibacter gotjawalensis]|uniref:Alpha-D-ribose 1-methylphosphonate 5-triphosphate synthase subunit PhnG n=1 Tax=Variibacter gotjawalensis TaxID=1333996 RepID=A0A0S3PT70_9BRAD|nr:alpha-D-ribose 1-methylphosphonate 5-triphosphate synthase subunit PhnG [Variibacter gotjawalensis]RZS51280.1 alpha-D-ribose 1-methylphosphonate 5-triphosphate synthase subunit PhnG [Variibacter gotjawalensis]BAT59113.1 alpha-D-ribose 1-methylphosphonate 5-triphosphate synthase subunit PhnG [Variibacter gotjawalensis]
MRLCAHAEMAELMAALTLCNAPLADDMRAPETGLVMARGRIGGDGAAFNVGETTVTRAAVTCEGISGFAYHLGRDSAKARAAATIDALWQSPSHRDAVENAIAPIAHRLATEGDARARRTAATRVNFFTMVRGED